MIEDILKVDFCGEGKWDRIGFLRNKENIIGDKGVGIWGFRFVVCLNLLYNKYIE